MFASIGHRITTNIMGIKTTIINLKLGGYKSKSKNIYTKKI